MLEAAGGDPLKAQDMEARLTETWWTRWLAYRQAIQNQQAKDAEAAPGKGSDGRMRGRRPRHKQADNAE